jgi:ATP-dependent Clp protease protease subunit
MKRQGMPKALTTRPGAEVRFDVPSAALAKWDSGIRAASSESANVIEVFDVIGEDYWTGEGVTAKKISAKLRELDGADVVVYYNSPGGDMFEGLAIYNLFREYPGQVDSKVVGMAASAASIAAMGGDTIHIGASAFFMIHNAWTLAAGNRHEFRAMADYLEPFDAAMAEIYAARTELSVEEIVKMLDAETWINGTDAVEKGFADELLASDKVLHDNAASASAAAKLDRALAQAGMPRSERRKLLAEVKSSKPSATVVEDMPRAVDKELLELSQSLRGIL